MYKYLKIWNTIFRWGQSQNKIAVHTADSFAFIYTYEIGIRASSHKKVYATLLQEKQKT